MPPSVETRQVINLYKTILRLHQRLPPTLQQIGDEYVKSEFRRHKNASASFVNDFLRQWHDYVTQLDKQLTSQTPRELGSNLQLDLIDQLSEDQLLQLNELKEEVERLKKR